MSEISLLQILLYLIIILLLVKPLGGYMARIYDGNIPPVARWFTPIEKGIYRLCSIQPEQEMNWKGYLLAMLLFNLLGLLAVYVLQRLQFYLPLNPQAFPAVAPDLALNTASSFVTNTNWQAYGGENTLSYLTQMLALTVQNFLSAATGMAILMAFIRGLVRHETNTIGNFWVDTVRGTLYILLPLALIFSVILVSQGVIQNFKPYQKIEVLQPTATLTQQVLPMGPAASQIAIKQLGTNGGGFFNTNAAHPFENPTALSNFFEMLAILLIPAALCYSFGVLVKDKRQGWAILLAMLILLIPLIGMLVIAEQSGNPALTHLGVDQRAAFDMPGGNMEGKEARFGIVNSALWTTVTTATSNGSVNSMLDSYTPLGGLVPVWLMHLGEVVFGGVGSGLYNMLVLVIITVFISGLMVGRTPEYLGKKIEPYEIKMASIAVLVMPLVVLLFTAIAVVTKAGTSSIANSGAHGFSEILYAFTSMSNNNGSAFYGLNANVPFYNLLGGLGILIGRFWIAIPTLAIAGALVRKKKIPISSGTLATHTPLFIALLICIALVLGALSFFPALSLGPIVEQLMLGGQYGH